METRRRTQRVTVKPPIAARAAGAPVYVVDASVSGVRLSHSTLLAEPAPCAISLDFHGTSIEFTADLRWTHPEGDRYQSGFEIQTIDSASNVALRKLIDECIERMPRFDRHELVHGVWRTTTTTESWQPQSGFTVASTESPHTVAFLRAAYSVGDRKMRERIRKLGELSITHPERRFDM
ncbi:MAG TPA: PilZ domain-containing protein [Thermoanaerobaculia bacterium]|nr:PilZ domain-containing protein [Thermoanaerobaculia bacterium]